MTKSVEGQQRAPLLSLRGINKSFGAVQVLRGVDLDVAPGEVTALVGDNGAGKSTLIKCIAGIHPFDDGEMVFEGQPVTIHGPKDANALGIEIVYQDLALCDNLDVVHNMFLGRELKSGITLNETEMEKRAGTTLKSLRCARCARCVRASRQLSGGQRQTVAIARAVLWNSKLVILDEPTAALGVAQTEQVLNLVRRLAEQRPRRGADHAQHERRLPGGGLDRLSVPRADGGAGAFQGRQQHAGDRVDHRGPLRATSGSQPAGRRRAGVHEHDPGEPRSPSSIWRPRPGQGGIGEAAGAYWEKVKGGDLGSLPAILGVVVLVIVFGVLRAGFVFDRAELRQPAQPGRGDHGAGDGVGVRPAVGRDRPLGRLHRRHGRGDPGRDDDHTRVELDPSRCAPRW